MSATLSDDSVFVSAMGLRKDDISDIITPEKANDIGERLVLFPKHLNASLDDNDIKDKLAEIATEHNVVVIVPSFERLNFWQDLDGRVPMQILSARDKNVETGIALLKSGSFKGLTILVNKYDGVDLPEDACRFLVIDGLPAMQREYDIAVHNINPGDKRICRELVQKIEQGMGRGVRSNNDYCIVVLMGNKLADVLVNQSGEQFFSKATLAQFNISKRLWSQLMESNDCPNIQEVFELADYVIRRDPEWTAASRAILSSVEYEKNVNIDSMVVAARNAFEKACMGRYDEAFRVLEDEKNTNTTLDNKSKGLLMQQMAEYKNFVDPAEAQEILLSGQNFNPSILKPINGIRPNKLNCFSGEQGTNVVKFIANNVSNLNGYIIHVNSILDDLIFADNSADSFERAINEIAAVIGIHSSRPEKENKKGPDNLWAIGDLTYFIIECKSGVKPDIAEISKSDCSQLLSSIQWFENMYAGNNHSCYPIIVHRATRFDAAASPDPRMRIMTEERLEQFKVAVRSFAKSIANDESIAKDAKEVQKLLRQYKLDGKAIIDAYTIRTK